MQSSCSKGSQICLPAIYLAWWSTGAQHWLLTELLRALGVHAESSLLPLCRALRTVPYPLLGENTLVLSDSLCVAPNREGQLCLMAR